MPLDAGKQELAQALKERDAALSRARMVTGERDGLLTQSRTLTRERDAALAARDRYKNMFFRKLVREAAFASIEKHGGKARILGIHVEQRLAIHEDGEDFPVVVLGEDGNTRHGVSLDDLLKEMRSDEVFTKAFPPKTETGAAKVANNPFLPGEHFNATEQAKLLMRNPGYAKKLQREAGAVVDGTKTATWTLHP